MMYGTIAGVSARAVRLRRASPEAAGGGAVSPAMSVEYVGIDGTRQRTAVVNGSTAITIRQHAAVLFDATATRGTHADVVDEGGAWFNMGYRINYGEALGTTWSYPVTLGYSMDEDVGQPVFGRVFSVVGAHAVRLKCKDPDGEEATISMTVIVQALGTPTNIPVAAGAWPTWVSGTTYTLDAGADYTAFGQLRTDPGGGTTSQRYGIRIVKTGSGANPIISDFNPDNRNEMTAGVARSADIVLVGIDSAHFGWSVNGHDFCGFSGGRCRDITVDAGAGYAFGQAVKLGRGVDIANNIRFPRGLILWNCGELNNVSSAYCIIGAAYGAIIQGVDMHRNSSANGKEHVLRPYFCASTVRYNRLRSSVDCKSYLKGSTLSSRFDAQPPPLWPSTDRVGDYDDALNYYNTYGGTPSSDIELPSGYMAKNLAFSKNQYGHSSESLPDSCSGIGPQNASPVSDNPRGNDFCFELPSFSSLEDDVHFGADAATGTDCELDGWYLGARGERLLLGAGAPIPTTSGSHTAKIPPGYSGPFSVEDTNSRPIPSAFA